MTVLFTKIPKNKLRNTVNQKFWLIQSFPFVLLEILRKKTRHAAGRLYLPKGVKAVAVDSQEYTRLNPAHIPADERFLYTYD